MTDTCHGDAARCAPIVIGVNLCGPPGLHYDHLAHLIGSMLEALLAGARITYLNYGGSCVLFLHYPARCGNIPVYGLDLSADYPDPSSWLSSYLEPQPNDALSCPADDRAVNLLRSADAASGDTRLQFYREAEQQLINDAIVVPLGQDLAAWEVRPYVVNYPETYWRWVTPAQWSAIYLLRH